MADGLQVITQADFSAGAFPGLEDIPPNGAEDIVDGLIRDDGAVERRGGSTYLGDTGLGTDTASRPATLWTGYLASGLSTVVILSDGKLYSLPSATWGFRRNVGAQSTSLFGNRPAAAGGMLFTAAVTSIYAYGGATSTALYNTGTISATQGSRTVTGAGTSWTGNVFAGSILSVSGGHLLAVASVDSNTQITLVEPWPSATIAGSAYGLGATGGAADIDVITPLGGLQSLRTYVASIYDRLIVGSGPRIIFSEPNRYGSFLTDDYHELPGGTYVTGLEPLGDRLLVFTTNGLWAISRLAYDLTDDFGNAQQTLERVNPGLSLWGDMGLANWSASNALVIPAVDDVYLTDGAQTRPIGGPISSSYRAYVEAGYRPGGATVFRGHYILPVLNGDAWIDTFVCKLQSGAWVRWAGYGGQCNAFAARVTADVPTPKLYGLSNSYTAKRAVDLTAAFTPSSSVKADADGTAQQLKITGRSIMLSETQDHTLRKVRLRFELDDAASDNPTFTAEWARGRPGSSFTALTGSASEGEDPYTWTLAKAGQQTRMRFTSNNAAAKAIVRAMEFHVRQHGRV